MKHDLPVTLVLVGLFVVSQLVGLGTISAHLQPEVNKTTGTIDISYPPTAIGEAPAVKNKSASFVYIVIGVLIGTLILLLFMRFKFNTAWTYWFLLSVILTLAVAWGVFIPRMVAIPLAIIFAIWKVYRPNVIIHNFTEVFIYTGIAVIFLPILNLVSVVVLLLLISGYDAYAVWKSKHMIRLATFQRKSNLFAGLVIPHKDVRIDAALGKGVPKKRRLTVVQTEGEREKTGRTAILGGGDIAFPLLFSSTVMDYLLRSGVEKASAFGLSTIITATTTIALFGLLFFAKKDKFYPAMPFISAGCFAGIGIIWLLGFL